MKNIFTTLTSIVILAQGTVYGAVVLATSHPNLDGTTSPDTFIVDTQGDKIAVGTGFAGVGTFRNSMTNTALTDVEIDNLVAANDYASLIGAFDPFVGTDNFSVGMAFQNGVPSAGAFAIQRSFNGATFVTETIYTFFGNGATLGGSSEIGLFRFGNKLVADLPAPAITPTTNFNFGNGNLLIGDATSIITTDSALGVNSPTSVTAIQLEAVAPIPEPSSALLGALGALALLRRRRN